ncbi:hypothetical protein [Streptomyces atratus]
MTEPRGVGLVRQALAAAREAAKKNGGALKEKPKRRTGQVVRRESRESVGLGAAITMMTTERGLVAPVVGGSVLAQFDDILAEAAPELAGHVQAVALDADTGRLDVVPDAAACGTKLRWIAPKLVAVANRRVPGANLRTLHVLAPAPSKSGPTRATVAPAVQPNQPRTKHPGYLAPRAAHRTSGRTRETAGAFSPTVSTSETSGNVRPYHQPPHPSPHAGQAQFTAREPDDA